MIKNNFAKDGFILKKNLFTEEEINKLNNYIENSAFDNPPFFHF